MRDETMATSSLGSRSFGKELPLFSIVSNKAHVDARGL